MMSIYKIDVYVLALVLLQMPHGFCFCFCFSFPFFSGQIITSGLHYTFLQAPHPAGQDLATAKIPWELYKDAFNLLNNQAQIFCHTQGVTLWMNTQPGTSGGMIIKLLPYFLPFSPLPNHPYSQKDTKPINYIKIQEKGGTSFALLHFPSVFLFRDWPFKLASVSKSQWLSYVLVADSLRS